MPLRNEINFTEERDSASLLLMANSHSSVPSYYYVFEFSYNLPGATVAENNKNNKGFKNVKISQICGE